MNKICDNCGQELPNTAVVCSTCGKDLENTGNHVSCANCGEKMDKSEKFCANCGAATYSLHHAGKASQHAAAGSMLYTKKPNSKKTGLVVCGAILLIVLIGVISMFSRGNNPERVLVNYVTALFDGNFDRMSRYSAIDQEQLLVEIMAELGFSEREFRDILFEETGTRNLADFMRQDMEEMRRELEREFGRNLRFSFEVIDSNTIRAREMRDYIERLERDIERLGVNADRVIDLDRINEMVELRLEMTIRGRDDHDTDTIWFTMVRIGRNWRVLDDFNDIASISRLLW